ncbi:ferredoxin reductase-like protein [Jaminaea rosea]|uniref:NADH-cytochrome b5 reductase n=1 Tax=Jaminaea rosea TaxID=1569628 RepID=A0A316URB6_9BASI|nr:ferredoxin reductase-like protein [Jaminaea rosea]PWN25675.1 ferredoxin reductase-like protein [Jaminaea rosea]
MLRTVFSPALQSSLRSASASTRQSVRGYASAPSSGSSTSNLPLLLGGAGVAGLGAWVLMGGNANGVPSASDAKAAAGKAAAAVPGVGGAASALNKDEWREFKLKEVVPYNHDSATFVFELPPGTDSGLSTASAVLFKGADSSPVKDKDGKPVIRPYTPVSTPATQGHMDFLIKKYQGGAMTSHVHGLKPGDSLSIKGPIPKFPYKANEFEEIGMIAGGSGITPMWQVMQDIANNASDKTRVTLVYTNKTESDILLREKFDALAAKDPRFKIVYGLDKLPSNFKGFQGYITPEIISQHLPAPGKADKVKVFVCGPPPQVESISGGKGPKGSQGELKGLLADAGYQESQVYKF